VDAENGFDELKNQWGWGGFTSRKLAPSRLMAATLAAIKAASKLIKSFFCAPSVAYATV
jgi:hypothetical protein